MTGRCELELVALGKANGVKQSNGSPHRPVLCRELDFLEKGFRIGASADNLGRDRQTGLQPVKSEINPLLQVGGAGRRQSASEREGDWQKGR